MTEPQLTKPELTKQALTKQALTKTELTKQGADEIGELLDNLPDVVNSNTALLRRGHYVTLTFLLGVDDLDYLIEISQGRVCSVTLRQLSTASGQFTIRASSEVWREHWRPFPKRNYHDIFSMLPAGLATIDGNLLPLMQNLQYFKDVIASLRSGATDATV